MVSTGPLLFGLDDRQRVCQQLRGGKIALLMNHASVDHSLKTTCSVINERLPRQLVAVLTPQHGMWGTEQANMIQSPHGRHPELDIPVFSLYSETRTPTDEMMEEADFLVIDLQDVGTRVYTFVWTASYCLEVAARRGVPVVVLDRPNPIGPQAEGPRLAPGFESFVGRWSLPMRHGLSMGELLCLLNDELAIGATMEVIPVATRVAPFGFETTARDWVPPSPNLPTCRSCRVYPGQVLLEGTNISEGRGTTSPFEICGAPFVDPFRLCRELRRFDLPGVRFRPLRFVPTFDKWQATTCGGIAIHVVDPHAYQSYRTSVAIIAAINSLWPADFEWLPPPYEYETVKPPIDIISGSRQLRESVDAISDCDKQWLDEMAFLDQQEWAEVCRPYRIYRS